MKKIFLSLITFSVLLFTIKAQNNTNYGTNAGNAGSDNSCFGYTAGDFVTGTCNSFFGSLSGLNTSSGTCNSFFGYRVGVLNTSGAYNVMLGAKSGTYNTAGNYNIYLGVLSGYSNISGNNNVMLGSSSGYSNIGTGNIFIGYQAGYNETGSNKLYISNSSTATPLIYGDFGARYLTINGVQDWHLTANVNLSISNWQLIGTNTVTFSAFLDDHSAHNPMAFAASQFYFHAGNVGIGVTDTKGYKLAVGGNIIAEKVVVKLRANWPDYVFSRNEKLMSLNEIENYIKSNGHLPEMPTQEQVKENGVDLGEVNTLLLKKVEQLTLLMIEQNKVIQSLEKKVNDLQK